MKLQLDKREFISKRLPALEAVEAQIVNVDVEKRQGDNNDYIVKFLLASPEEVEGVTNDWAGGYKNHQVLTASIFVSKGKYLTKWKPIFNFIAELSLLKTGELDMADEIINGGLWNMTRGEWNYNIDWEGTEEQTAEAIADYLREFEGESYWFPIIGSLTESAEGDIYVNGEFDIRGRFSPTNFREENVFATKGEAEKALRNIVKGQQNWNTTVHAAYTGDPKEEFTRKSLNRIRGLKQDYWNEQWDENNLTIENYETFQRNIQQAYLESPAPYSKKIFKDSRTDRNWSTIPLLCQEKLVSLGYKETDHAKIYGITSYEIQTDTEENNLPF